MWEVVEVLCPYCFEAIEILLAPEDRGELVQDCEVCCNPLKINVLRDPDGNPRPTVERLQ